jgi:hypothetical protein
MTETLVFLEFEDEAQAYIKSCNKDKIEAGEETIITLSMAVQLALKRKGIPYQTTLPYFDNQAHARVVTRSEEWLNHIESYIDPDKILVRELSFRIRPIFNYFLWLAEIIAESVQRIQPVILCSPPGQFPGYDPGWRLTPNYRVLGFFASTFARQKQLEYRRLQMSDHESSNSPINNNKDTGSSRSRLILGRSILQWLIKRLCANRRILMIATDSYGLGKVGQEIASQLKGHLCMRLDTNPCSATMRTAAALLFKLLKSPDPSSLVHLPVFLFSQDNRRAARRTEQINRNLEKLAAQIEGDWRKNFQYRDLDLAPTISRRLKEGTRNYMLTIFKAGERLPRVLETIVPTVVLSPFSAGEMAFLGDQCHRMGIPAILIPHGSLAPPRSPLEEIEQRRLSQTQMLGLYQYQAAQTLLAAKHAAYYGISETTINTGPVLFARIEPEEGQQLRQKLGIPPDTAVIVYAAAQRKRSSIRFQIFETEDEYLAAMSDLVLAVNQLKKVHLVIKLHPSSEFSDSDMRLFLPDCHCLTILHKEPFFEVLSVADLLVSYISTTVEEAILNRIPVVLYDKWTRYSHVEAFDCNTHDPMEWEADAAYYVSDPIRLVRVLKHALLNRDKARSDDQIYQKHMFKPGDVQPLDIHIENLVNNSRLKD